MMIKFDFDINRDLGTLDKMDKGLINIFNNSGIKFVDPVVFGNYFLEKDDTNSARNYFDSGTFVYPGMYYVYDVKAKFEESIEKNFEESKKNYLFAYLLSEKNRIIYEDMTNNFATLKRNDLIDELNSKYGKPLY